MSRLLICLLLLFSSASTFAVEVTNLYQDTLKVADKSRDARLAASREALLNVLVKVSGDTSADQKKSIKAKKVLKTSEVKKVSKPLKGDKEKTSKEKEK